MVIGMNNNFNNKFKHLKIRYKKDPKKYLVFITSLILMFACIIGTSYAVLTYISKTDNSTVVEFGTVALNFQNETNEISLDGAIPQENSEAIKNNKEYEFTVKNDGTVNSVFELTLDNTCSLDRSYKIDNKYVKVDKCIPDKYIKVALKEGNSKYEVIENLPRESTGKAKIEGATASGEGLVFDGNDDYVKIIGTEKYDFGTSLTVGAKIKSNGFASNGTEIIGNLANGSGGFEFFVGSAGKICFQTRTSSTQNATIHRACTSAVIENGKWYTAVATYNGNQIKMYLNGALDGTYDLTEEIKVSTNEIYIGTNPAWLGREDALTWNPTFNGTIAEAMTLNKVLTEEEIEENYSNGLNHQNDDKTIFYQNWFTNDKYVLDADYLTPGETRNYKMKVWLDYDTPNEYNPGTDKIIAYSGKLNINYEQGEEEYEENAYIIRYNANGGQGTMDDEKILLSESTTVKTNAFTRTGYTFKGFSLEKDGTPKYQGGESVENLTNLNSGIVNLYAIWEPITYTITYNVNGGTGTMNSTTHVYDEEKPLPNSKFSKENLMFAGWGTSASSVTVKYKDGELVKNLTATAGGTVTLYAIYIEDLSVEHQIIYNSGSGTGNMTNTSFYGNSATLEENEFTAPTGYHFVGWDTNDSADNVVYEDGETVENIVSAEEETKNLYAVYSPNEYKYEYYSYDGTTKYGESTHIYNVSSKLTSITTLGGVAPSDSVTFYGWAASSNQTTLSHNNQGTIHKLNKPHGSVTKIYAIWRSEAIYLTWISGINRETQTKTGPYYYYNAGTSVSIKTPTPTAISSWTTLGWRNDTTAGGKEWTSGYTNVYSKSATYYAVYSREHTVNFYSGVNNATVVQKSGTRYYNSDGETLPTAVTITIPASSEAAAITSWSKQGWRNDTTAGAKEYDFGASLSILFTTRNFYTSYSRTLTISYNGNTATSGSTSNTTKTVYLNSNQTTTGSQSVTLASSGFSKTGYSFSKWAVGSASGTKYAAKASYDPAFEYNASSFSKTMYAIWTINKATLTIAISYDNSTYPEPSSGYKTSTYQTLSDSSKTINYGSSTTVTASPAYPDDRYKGSVSCNVTNVTATIKEGTGTTTRTDTITIKNNNTSNVSGTCTIKYIPKWRGIAKGNYTSGSTLSAGYGNTTYTWTVVSDNGDNTGLAYNATNSSGTYASAGSTLTTNFLNGYSILKSDAANGGLVKQGSYYISTDSGISTNLTASDTDFNYWVGSNKFYNRVTRNKYDRVTYKYVRGFYAGRSDKVTGPETAALFSAYTDYKTTKIISAGIQSVTGTNRTLNSDGTLTFTQNSFDTSQTELTDTRYSRYLTAVEIWGATTNSIWFLKHAWNLDDNNEWEYNYTWDTDDIIKNTWRISNFICGGDYHGKRVIFRYKTTDYFYYGNEATGSGWDTTNNEFNLSSALTMNETIYDSAADLNRIYLGLFAGVAGSDCSTGTGCPESGKQTLEGYTRYHRYYHFNNYSDYGYCYKRTKYTDQPTNYTVTLRYRPYIKVRER